MHLSRVILRRCFVIPALCVLLVLPVPSAIAETSAIAVVDRYMHGLFAGDVEAIRGCLDDRFQARRKNTFNDPTYAAFLIDRYGGAAYRIVNQAAQNNGTIVDVEITYRSGDAVVIRLMLNRRNQIVDEIPI
ncbi:hypothetical protein [Desulfosarcina sp.]|uniref:hypothetical protein n=1 Tax=Desulfosarcina sp. TaxID=2027861 RepID=UPI00397046C1